SWSSPTDGASGRWGSEGTAEEGQYRQDNKDKEEYLCRSIGDIGYQTKAKESGDQGDDEENYSPSQHVQILQIEPIVFVESPRLIPLGRVAINHRLRWLMVLRGV